MNEQKAFHHLNKLQKFLLKIRDKEAYNNYKFLKKLQDVNPAQADVDPSLQDIHFKHSGNIGDIIYAVPAMQTLADGRNIYLHLNIDQPGNYGRMKHPLGKVMLTKTMVNMLHPLITSQPLFKTCDIYTNQVVDYDLDKFREYPFNYKLGHICRWYFLTFAITADLSKPWLKVKPDNSFNDAIVIARSFRYRMPGISYAFLNKYPRLVFVGLKDEYEDVKLSIPKLEYKTAKDFYELASVIAGARCFIGNQSFPFAVAEGLKVTRVLEVFHQSPNVIVEGKNGFDFCYQPQFEKVANKAYNYTNEAVIQD